MRNRKKAFTLIELLVVVSIIALLVAILMPALNKAREQAKRIVCSNNIKSIVSFYNMEALENDDKYLLPNYGGYWLWDLDWSTTDRFEKHGGVREMYYCPSDRLKDEEEDQYWEYSPPNFRVISYFLLLDWSDERAQRDGLTKNASGIYRNETIRNYGDSARKDWVRTMACKFPSEQELMIDAILSAEQPPDVNIFAADYTEGNFDSITYGGSDEDKSNHTTTGGTPLGGNMGYVDGHVEWKDSSKIHWRTTAVNGGGPYFWW